jgi:type 1 glutamine amidotransferase
MTLNRRRFLQRATQAAVGMGAAASFPATSSRVCAAPGADAPLKVCMLSGSEEYKSNESLAAFQEELEKNYPIRCSRAFWTSRHNLPGLDALASCDLMLLFTKRLELPDDQMKPIKEYCLSGRPIVGIRTASHAFDNWLELDRLVFGGDYSGHFKSGLTTQLKISHGASEHPILEGFAPFKTSTKLYKNPHLADDVDLLLTGSIPDHTEPVAWTRLYRDGRMFYTSLGGPEDFERDVFKKMLVNAILWTTHRD